MAADEVLGKPPVGAPFGPTPGRDRFVLAVAAAALIEAAGLLALALAPRPPAPVPPSVVQLQMLPPAPTPVAKPAPPKPPPPKPKPVPAPPVATPVLPPPPVPAPPAPQPPPPRPHHPSAHHVIHHIAPPPPPPQVMTTPAPPAPVTAAPAPSPVAEQTALSRYVGEVRAIVLGELEVPQEMIDAGLEGDCVLAFTLNPDGSILSASVFSPSGIRAVNEAALEALRRARLPAFPTEMGNTPHGFTLPVHVSGNQP